MRLIQFLICSSLLVHPAYAAVLGDIQLRSALGERFNARINIIASESEELGTHCFRLLPVHEAGTPHFSARLSFESNENGGVLTLRGDEALQEPLLSFSIRLRCPSEKSASFQRDYNVLLDPREYRGKQSADLAPLAPAPRRNLPALSGVWQSQEGDSVERIARAYFPQDRASRARMVDEIYRLNPDLAQNTYARLPLNTDVRLPDRKRLLPNVAVSEERPPEPEAQLLAPAKESLQITAPYLPRLAQGGFQLRLSGSLLSSQTKAPLSPDENLRARERLQLLESDDQAAQLLQFKYQISQLEKQLAAVQGRSQTEIPSDNTPVFSGINRFSWPSAWWLLLLLFIPPIYLMQRQRRIAQADMDIFPLGQNAYSSGAGGVPLSERFMDAVPDRSLLMGAMSNFSQAASDWSRDDVDVVQPKNVSEEAQMLLDHGLVTQAVNLLKSEIEQYPSSLALWMMLFDVYVTQGMRQEFQNRAVGFRLQFSSDGLWQQVQGMGRALDPDNPLYLSLDETASPLMFAQEGMSFAVPESKVEHVDFATGELVEYKQDPWLSVPEQIDFSVEMPDPLSSLEVRLPEITGLDLSFFQTEDPVLQLVVEHLEQQDIHSACQTLEQLLYRGTMEQRQTAIKWLDVLIPLQI